MSLMRWFISTNVCMNSRLNKGEIYSENNHNGNHSKMCHLQKNINLSTKNYSKRSKWPTYKGIQGNNKMQSMWITSLISITDAFRLITFHSVTGIVHSKWMQWQAATAAKKRFNKVATKKLLKATNKII